MEGFSAFLCKGDGFNVPRQGPKQNEPSGSYSNNETVVKGFELIKNTTSLGFRRNSLSPFFISVPA